MTETNELIPAETADTENDTGNADYDSAWKEVIEELFEPFMEFFFPEVHVDIDFDEEIEFLSNELREVTRDSNSGKKIADVLAKVKLKNGKYRCIGVLIHVEVQGQQVENLERRMYEYNYRAADKFGEPGMDVFSAAVLTDENPNWRPDEFRVDLWKFQHRMKYPIIKIIDYKTDPDLIKLLETSDSPMAIVVKTQLKSHEYKKKDNDSKFNVTLELIRMCYRAGYDKKRIRTLLKFIDWVIRLPDYYTQKISHEIINIEEENKMKYIPSWERKAYNEGKQEGEQIGEQKGEEKGEQKGILKGKKETAKNMLLHGVPIETVIKYTGLTAEEIKKMIH